MANYAIINTCDWGSTGKIAKNLQRGLTRRGHVAFFCYGHGQKRKGQNYRIDNIADRYLHSILFRITGKIGIGSYLATRRLLRFLQKKEVSKIFLINLHGNYLNERLFFDYLNTCRIPVVYIMADESAFLGNCTYRNGCTQYLDGCKRCPKTKWYQKLFYGSAATKGYNIKVENYSKLNAKFVAPEFVVNCARNSPIIKNKVCKIIDEAIDTRVNVPRDVTELRRELKIDKEKIVIGCVAPYPDERKGVKFLIEAARLLEHDSRFVFVHVGYKLGDKGGLPTNYIAIDYVYDQNTLCNFYSLADIFVFPSLQDTMPNTCLEALSCGTPLLCFDISGMPYLGDATVLKLAKPMDAYDLASKIAETNPKTEKIINLCREYALRRYDGDLYVDKLMDAMG